MFLAGGFGTVIHLNGNYYKALRLTSSVLAAELNALDYIFDVAYTVLAELGLSLSQNPLPMCALVKSKSLFYTFHKESLTSKQRLMIDIAIASEGYHSGQISEICLVEVIRTWLIIFSG